MSGKKRSKRRPRGEIVPPRSPVHTELCKRCGQSRVLVTPGRPTICEACHSKRSVREPSRRRLPSHSSGVLRHAREHVDTRLSSLAATDSSQWPSSARLGNRAQSQAGADRAPRSATFGRHHRLLLLEEFRTSAQQRGLIDTNLRLQLLLSSAVDATLKDLAEIAAELIAEGGTEALHPAPSLPFPVKRVPNGAPPATPPRGVSTGPMSGAKRPTPERPPVRGGLTRRADPVRARPSTAPVTDRRIREGVPSPKATSTSPPANCPICNLLCPDLAEHLRLVHKIERVACPRCAETQSVTLGEATSCDGCGKKFVATTGLAVSHPRAGR